MEALLEVDSLRQRHTNREREVTGRREVIENMLVPLRVQAAFAVRSIIARGYQSGGVGGNHAAMPNND